MQYGLTGKHILHNNQNILCNNEIIFQNQKLQYKIPFVKGLCPLDCMSFLGEHTAIALPSHADDWAGNATPPPPPHTHKKEKKQKTKEKTTTTTTK